ncbi:MAG: anaerobic ribonucleoside-triphosphate reductase activating protein [Desulfobacterales bacterium]
MRFGGIQKNSFIDFPGKISCVVFASGCNFHCPYCHNPELVSGCGNRVSGDAVLDFLRQRKGWLDGVVISGGEPTLQGDLSDFCEHVKSMGYPVKLDTNGSRPKAITRLIRNKLVDYIAMDIKTAPDLYNPTIASHCPPESIRESISIIMQARVPYEFRTTCVRPFVDDAIMDRITYLIQGADLYVLQRFVNGDVLLPEFFSGTNHSFGDSELSHLKCIAESRVGTCLIR